MVCEIFLELVSCSVLNAPLGRWEDVNKQYPRGTWYVLTRVQRVYLTVGKVAIQEIAEGVNKMKRSFLLVLAIVGS